jgi:D-glycero-D-manno-heptose 1,7-bisphosphate phosphatase
VVRSRLVRRPGDGPPFCFPSTAFAKAQKIRLHTRSLPRKGILISHCYVKRFYRVVPFRPALCFNKVCMKQAVFLERDGVLNAAKTDKQQQVSPLTLEELHLSETATPLLKKLKSVGFVLIATTNQPGLSRGYQNRRELDRMHDRLRKVFPLDDILVCPHDENDRCPCRKPKPGLFVEAGFKWLLDLDRSFVISDKWQDAEAARIAGSTSLLLQSPWVGKVHRDFLLPDLEAAVTKILELKGSSRAAVA